MLVPQIAFFCIIALWESNSEESCPGNSLIALFIFCPWDIHVTIESYVLACRRMWSVPENQMLDQDRETYSVIRL